MKTYKILFVINNYSGGGASRALKLFYERIPYISTSSKIYVKSSFSANIKLANGSSVECVNGRKVVEEFIRGRYDFMHWFKSDSSNLFNDIITEMNKKRIFIPIITTVLQNPTFYKNMLSPSEIVYSKLLVFIDKSSYNNPLYSFIPEYKKRMIYFSVTTEKDVEEFDKILKGVKSNLTTKHDAIIYGRGSTLNKCPHDMFEKVFDKISNPKLFKIIGGGDRKWIESKISERKNIYEVQLYDALPYEEWLKQLSTFDIFLYYLPKNGYSSLDGTLGQAMMMGKPVVYYGPEAPKERFINGFNGLVADTIDEIPLLCNKLANDQALREFIGNNARITTLEQLNISVTTEKYMEAYHYMLNQEFKRCSIPRKFIFHYKKVAIFLFVRRVSRIPIFLYNRLKMYLTYLKD